MDNNEIILHVDGLEQDFKLPGGRVSKVVRGVSFDVHRGEVFSIVGESGSGKSTIGKAIIRLNNPTGGHVIYKGKDIAGKLTKADTVELRRSMQMIYQDPMASLNPRLSIGDIVAEGLDNYHLYADKTERDKKIQDTLLMVGLGPQFMTKYPHHLSGGQRQRVGIARSIIMEPDLIIADECISALDVSVQAQVINLLLDIQKKTNTAIVFIAHDLSMVKYISDRIGVLHRGYLLEVGTSDEIFLNPQHPYTRSLIDTIPTTNPVAEKLKHSPEYNYEASGLDYAAASYVHVDGSHYVLR